MTDSTVAGNLSDDHIGALGLDASFSLVDNATGRPVAVLPPTTNSITFDRVTISGNTTTGAAAGGSGYAMNYSTTPGLYSILNSTISGNLVTNGGDPGLTFQSFNPSSQTNAMRVVIRNSTIARNTASSTEAVSFGSFNNANPSSQNPFNGSLVVESSVLGGRQGTSNPTSLFGVSSGFAATISNTLIENNGDSFSAQCGGNFNICNTDAKLVVCSIKTETNEIDGFFRHARRTAAAVLKYGRDGQRSMAEKDAISCLFFGGTDY